MVQDAGGPGVKRDGIEKPEPFRWILQKLLPVQKGTPWGRTQEYRNLCGAAVRSIGPNNRLGENRIAIASAAGILV